MSKPDYQKQFEQIHEAGSKRHPESWFGANQHAVQAAWGASVNPSDPQIKYLLAMTVLKVLDFVEPAERAQPDREKGSR